MFVYCFVVYKKHYPPALNDEVWRLEKIGKDGSFHKRLSKSGIFTVEDFLRHVVRDPQKLRTVCLHVLHKKVVHALSLLSDILFCLADSWKRYVE